MFTFDIPQTYHDQLTISVKKNFIRLYTVEIFRLNVAFLRDSVTKIFVVPHVLFVTYNAKETYGGYGTCHIRGTYIPPQGCY